MAWITIEGGSGKAPGLNDKGTSSARRGSGWITIQDNGRGPELSEWVTPESMARGESLEPDAGLHSSFLDPLEALLGGGIGEGIFRGAKRLSSFPRRSLLGSEGRTAEDIATIKQKADRYGIELTPATSTGSRKLAEFEHSLSEGPMANFGAGPIVARENDTMERAIFDQFERMGANGSNLAMGEVFSQSAKSLLDAKKDLFRQRFGSLFASYGDTPLFRTSSLKSAAEEYLKQAERVPTLKGTTAWKDAKKISQLPDEMAWKDWQAVRTQIGGKAEDKMLTSKADKGFYKDLYGRLMEDLDESVRAIGNEKLANEYRQTVEDYKQFKDLYGRSGTNDVGSSFIQRTINRDVAPESIGPLMNRSTIRSERALDAGGIDSDGIPLAKKVSATAALLGSKAKGKDSSIWLGSFLKETGDQREGFRRLAAQPQYSFKSAVGKRGELLRPDAETLPREMMEPVPGTSGTDLGRIDDLRGIASDIQKKRSVRNTSATAKYNYLNTIKLLGPVRAAFQLAKDATLNAAYKSKTLRDWFEKGVIDEKTYKEAMDRMGTRGRRVGVATQELLKLDDINRSRSGSR